jgi:hypothetical protein
LNLKSLRLNLAGNFGPRLEITFASDWKKGRGIGMGMGICGEAVRGGAPPESSRCAIDAA